MFSDTKKQKMSIIKSIITHSGSFHADESLAIFMLKTLPKYKDHSIIRTRNPAVIAEGDIVVDVGGEYNPATNRYDHHQRGFVETYSPAYDVKLSSAGLIYKHFGTKVVQTIVGSHPQTDEIVSRVYKKLILGFDGHDNGVSAYPTDIAAKYESPTTIADRVSRLNPDWNEASTDADFDRQFLKAVEITGEELVYWVTSTDTGEILRQPVASGSSDCAACNRFAVQRPFIRADYCARPILSVDFAPR
jgi:uncharacterized UPF0160 family protein